MNKLSSEVIGKIKKRILGRKVILRNMEIEDIQNNMEVFIYDGKVAESYEEAKEVFEKIKMDCNNGESIHWAICKTSDGELVGTMGFYRCFENNRAEIGYIVKENERNNGYCSEAIELACNHALNELDIKEIVAYTRKGNIKSIRVLEKNGFKISENRDDESEYELVKRK